MGTHPNAPSIKMSTGENLKDVVLANPELLTPNIAAKYNGDLPFLFKVLSIQKALSIQAHPDKKLAEHLFRKYPNIYKGIIIFFFFVLFLFLQYFRFI